MSTRRMLGFTGVLLFMSALAMALPGCGGGPAPSPDGTVKDAPVLNPAPGVVPLDKEPIKKGPP